MPILPVIPFIILGSLLPDIDHPFSVIGSIVAPIQVMMKHRGMTHTLVGLCFFAIPVLLFGSTLNLFGFVYGYLSHLLLDLLTPMGIKIAYPFDKRMYSFNLCKTGGFAELALFCLSLQYILLR